MIVISTKKSVRKPADDLSDLLAAIFGTGHRNIQFLDAEPVK